MLEESIDNLFIHFLDSLPSPAFLFEFKSLKLKYKNNDARKIKEAVLDKNKEAKVIYNNVLDQIQGILEKTKNKKQTIEENISVLVSSETLYYRLISIPFYSSDINKILLIAIDLTIEKRLDERIHFMNKVAKIGMWRYHISNENLWLSEELEELFLLSKDEKIEIKDLVKIIVPEQRKLAYKKFWEAFNYKNFFDCRLDICLDNKTNKHLRIICNPEIKYGKIVSLTGIIQDISDLKHSEDKIKILSTVVEQSPAIVIITDTNGLIEYVNPKFEEITGYDFTEVLKKKTNFLKSDITPSNIYKELWLTIKSGKEWMGDIQNKKKDGSFYWVSMLISPLKNSDGKVTHFVSIQEDVTIRKEYEKKLLDFAQFDDLTGVYNRRMFLEKLDHFLISKNTDKLALLYIDLDNFKKVNDIYGHLIGDQVLIAATKQIQSNINEHCILSRVGGDKFSVIYPGYKSENHLLDLAEKIITDFTRPFHIDTKEILISPSIGVAIYPENTEIAAELIKLADICTYSAKRQGRNQVQFFNAEIHDRLLRESELRESLEHAIENEEIKICFQGIFDCKTGELKSAEALMRWKNSKYGDISPSEFIPIAEKSGVIQNLSFYLINKMTSEFLNQVAIQNKKIKLAINISPTLILNKSIFEIISENKLNEKFYAKDIELEITESLLIEESQETFNSIKKLKSLGFELSIDDFGTGYSSLSYLRRYPFDTLKIDKSFIDDIDKNEKDLELVISLISMAHSLDLKVIAEGVEKQSQLDLLKKNSCDYYQGFISHRPCGVEEFLKFLEKN